MKLRRFLLVGLASLLSSGAVAQTEWETYLESPTPDNAKRVQEATYSEPNSRANRLFEDLWLLEIQVTSGDREAVRLAFRLFSSADGHFAETLDIMLGRLIRIDPTLFLRELEIRRKQVARLDSLLGNFGEAYVDRFPAQEYETEKRIAALMTVNDPALTAVRDECVAELRKQLGLLKQVD